MRLAHGIAAAKPKSIVVLAGFNDGVGALGVDKGARLNVSAFSRGFQVGYHGRLLRPLLRGVQRQAAAIMQNREGECQEFLTQPTVSSSAIWAMASIHMG